MSWSRIRGQDTATAFLRRSIAAGQVSHAYIFLGPDGAGKSTAGRIFAQALLCREGGEDPCGDCRDCRLMEAGSHPDFAVFAPRGKARLIKIEQIMELQRAVGLKSHRGGRKIFIVDEADSMNLEASNRFLKTLEEPPEGTVLILTTSRPERLPSTVTSRCLAVRFYPWSFDLMSGFLAERTGLPESSYPLVHRLAGGSPGRALVFDEDWARDWRAEILDYFSAGPPSAAREIVSATERWSGMIKRRMDDLSRQRKKDRREEFAQADPAVRDEIEKEDQAWLDSERRACLALIFEYILSWYRDLLLYRITEREEVVANRDRLDSIRKAARVSGLRRLREMLDHAQTAGRDLLNRNASLPIVLTSLLVRAGGENK